MQNKQAVYSYNGMQQDISNSKYQPNFYFQGNNIRINATTDQGTSSVMNEKGNSLIITIPKPVINKSNPNLKKILYNNKELIYKTTEIDNLSSIKDQVIIGHSNSRNHVILFTTDNEGFDCIWKLTYDTYDLTLLYLRNMGFSKNNPIQTINNFENKNVDKVYWVDFKSQMRFININHSITNQDIEELIDVSIDVIDMVGKYNLNQPIISNITSGGTHTSGMIQYAYNLYKLNSSQTKISPLTELIPLGKGNQGGNLNEIVSTLPIVDINNIDSNYTNIRVYAIKYTSYNEIPSVSLIKDRPIPDSKSIQVFDDGSVISTLSLEEFVFLGSDIIIPKHINSKDNRLFFANYQEINFDVDLDTRAYSFLLNSTNTVVYKNLFLDNNNPNGTPLTVFSDYDVPKNHDAVNLFLDIQRYQYNNSIQGGEGKYLKYELTQSNKHNKNSKYFKDDEIYRLGIVFYNKYGQKSLPKWVADFKAPSGNLDGKYNTLKVTLKSDFFTWLNTTTFLTEYDIPVGYKILIAERTVNDKTIVANGLLSTMMINNKIEFQTNYDNVVKLPNILVRNFGSLFGADSINPLLTGASRPLFRLSDNYSMSRKSGTASDGWDTETPKDIFFGRSSQFNKMVQLHSPEILFNNSIILSESLQFRLKGGLINNENNAWSRVFLGDKKIHEGRNYGSLTPYYKSLKKELIQNEDSDGSWEEAFSAGLLSGDIARNGDKSSKIMFDRHYETGYTPAITSTKYDIYGKPELVEKGQSGTNYNNDSKFRYSNSLEGFSTDGNTQYSNNNDGPFTKRLINVNTYANKNVIFVPLKDQPFFSNNEFTTKLQPVALDEIGLDDFNVFGDLLTGLDSIKEYGLIGELVRPDIDIYLGKIYGGNSYEDKKRTNYIEIGNYSKLDSLYPTVNINSPGDTFVGIFKFLRMLKTDKDITSTGTGEIGEIISVLCETTVDLKNRSDTSFNDWKSKFQPLDDEYHKYNRVYSQISNLIQNKDVNYNIKKINNFDTNIISSKLKSSGELIDSWTDILQNEVLTLDGKHGAINSLVSFNDQIYGIQDKALAQISINPRVQIQGDDGISVELGTGGVLQEYRYASTESGTINKWSVIPTSRGIYYYDLLNKAFMVFNGQINNISDEKNMHSYFISNTELEGLKIDNPLIKQGISSGYDQINDDVFMTFHRTNNKTPFTISFNERRNQFVSFYDYIPSTYIGNGQHFITTSPDLKSVYRQYAGNYGNFYGINYPSYVILNVNPEANMDTVFDNIMYKSEVYLNDVDQPDKTLTSVKLYSEYQNSGLVPLTVGRNSNLRRKFRDWNAILPRNQGSRERIRNPWVKLLLQFDNNLNYKLILHDIILSYSV